MKKYSTHQNIEPLVKLIFSNNNKNTKDMIPSINQINIKLNTEEMYN